MNPQIAPPARVAGVHRATVYRRTDEPVFVEAMHAAAQEFFRRVRLRIAHEQSERKRLEREKARRPMRCENLAKARAAKRR